MRGGRSVVVAARRTRVPPAAARCPPVFIAAYGGHVACIEALLDANADPDAPHPAGATPLQTAAERGHVGAVTCLLGHGADVDGHDAVSHTRRHGRHRRRHHRPDRRWYLGEISQISHR